MESSVKAELEGKTVSELIGQVKAEEKRFLEHQVSVAFDFFHYLVNSGSMIFKL